MSNSLRKARQLITWDEHLRIITNTFHRFFLKMKSIIFWAVLLLMMLNLLSFNREIVCNNRHDTFYNEFVVHSAVAKHSSLFLHQLQCRVQADKSQEPENFLTTSTPENWPRFIEKWRYYIRKDALFYNRVQKLKLHSTSISFKRSQKF
jgi:hypothetical protein